MNKGVAMKAISYNQKVRSMKYRFTFAVVAILCSVTCLVAQTPRETPPAGGQPKPFVFPSQTDYKLSNGMRVTMVQYGTIPKVAMQATIRVGSINERENQRWISDMVSTLLKEGTTTRTPEQIARETAEMGGSIFTAAATDKTTVGGEVLSEFDTRFLALMADVMLNPRFAPESLEEIRANKLRELAVSRAQPGTQAWERFRHVVFPGHPYGTIFPSEDQVKGYTLQDVKSFYYNQYGAARTHLYIVGQFDQAKMRSAIEKAFGSWKKGSEPIRNVPRINARRSLDTIDRKDAPQSTIYLGMPAVAPSDDDFVKFVVMDSILGGSFGSRITRNIREDKGYTYSPGSFVWNRYKTGYWVQSADVTTEHTGASLKEILFEIERLRNEKPSEAELQAIKNYLVGIYVLQNSTRTGVIGQLDMVDYNDLPRSYIDSYVQKLAAVSSTDVTEMVRKYLTLDKMTIVVVGDRGKIDSQVKAFDVP